jgi:hypothetical protein
LGEPDGGERAGITATTATGKHNFPPDRAEGAEGGPDFTSRRRMIDSSQLFKGRSENVFKVLAVHGLGQINTVEALVAPEFLVRLSLLTFQY